MRIFSNMLTVTLLTLTSMINPAIAGPVEDYTIDRKEVYDFTQKPLIQKEGDSVTIQFTSKDFCDATVVIEQADGLIIRHLASGVLGPNAPEPFQKNSLKQTLVWDGKNELGRYVDNFKGIRVRVSLGLRARYEKPLQWHPKERIGLRRNPMISVQPEGVYVYEGSGIEYVRMFNHKGEYVRTVCPFPANKVKQVKGLPWDSFPDGLKAPRRRGYWNGSFLVGGEGDTRSGWGSTAKAFTAQNGTIVTIRDQICRIGTDGTSADHKIYGPRFFGPKTKFPVRPKHIAISPDLKWIYFTGFYYNHTAANMAMLARIRWHRQAVYRVALDGKTQPELFAGHPSKTGSDDKHFHNPCDVCVDDRNRVYVADSLNDRVQIFSENGKLVKSLPVRGPAVIRHDKNTKKLFVFSWCMSLAHGYVGKVHKVPAMLRAFEPFKSNTPSLEISLPLRNYRGNSKGYMRSPKCYDEVPLRAAVDTWSDPMTVWLVDTWSRNERARVNSISLYELRDNKLVRKENWNDLVEKELTRWRPPWYRRQRMVVDPLTGDLYVAESGKKAFDDLTWIDPDTGKKKVITLPYTSEDFSIDWNKHLYLRCDRLIGRHDLKTLREIPYDYGEERRVSWSSSARLKSKLISGLVLTGNRPCWWHESGMSVMPGGEVVASCCNDSWKRSSFTGYTGGTFTDTKSRSYKPKVYSGRLRYSEIHVWDKHGKMIKEDVVQGVMDGHGTYTDPKGNIYYLPGGNRVYENGKDFFPLTGCVMKFKPGKGKFYAARKTDRVPVRLRKDIPVDGLPRIRCGSLGIFYVQGAEWIYPGIGYVHPNAPCQCWKCRFTVDYFGRVFAPETVRCQIAVLDTNGNLIMHIGKYGNPDDGVPLISADQHLRTEKPRSIGGDEVSIAYANYVGTHTDRRLFIGDGGNSRLISLKLDYHQNEILPLEPE